MYKIVSPYLGILQCLSRLTLIFIQQFEANLCPPYQRYCTSYGNSLMYREDLKTDEDFATYIKVWISFELLHSSFLNFHFMIDFTYGFWLSIIFSVVRKKSSLSTPETWWLLSGSNPACDKVSSPSAPDSEKYRWPNHEWFNRENIAGRWKISPWVFRIYLSVPHNYITSAFRVLQNQNEWLLFTDNLNGKVTWLTNFQFLQDLQDSISWPPVYEIDTKTPLPEVSRN